MLPPWRTSASVTPSVPLAAVTAPFQSTFLLALPFHPGEVAAR